MPQGMEAQRNVLTHCMFGGFVLLHICISVVPLMEPQPEAGWLNNLKKDT